MPVSIREQRLAKQAAALIKDQTAEYVILDPAHHPDLKGEFAASRVYRRGDKQLVSLTPAQARFYLDQGGIEPLNPPDTTTDETPAA